MLAETVTTERDGITHITGLFSPSTAIAIESLALESTSGRPHAATPTYKILDQEDIAGVTPGIFGDNTVSLDIALPRGMSGLTFTRRVVAEERTLATQNSPRGRLYRLDRRLENAAITPRPATRRPAA